jgi:hypothetical protein
MYRGYGSRQAVRPRNTGLIMLALQVMNIGLEHIPPATLVLVGFQTFVFAYPIFQPYGRLTFPRLDEVCLSAHAIANHKQVC